jgi:hypothetical protein
LVVRHEGICWLGVAAAVGEREEGGYDAEDEVVNAHVGGLGSGGQCTRVAEGFRTRRWCGRGSRGSVESGLSLIYVPLLVLVGRYTHVLSCLPYSTEAVATMDDNMETRSVGWNVTNELVGPEYLSHVSCGGRGPVRNEARNECVH